MKNTWLKHAEKIFEKKVEERVFTRSELTRIFEEDRIDGHYPPSLNPSRFIQTLIDAGNLQKVEIPPQTTRNSPTTYRPFTRYIWREVSPLQVALSLRTGSYLSHGTAAAIHKLLPETTNIYVNKEQTEKPRPDGDLTQESINRAFSNAPRLSKYKFKYKNTSLVLLNGKHSNDYEVINFTTESGHSLRLTSVERTLIDIVVRPTYAGGVAEVLKAFRVAKAGISINKLLTVLKHLEHVYPYHQSLGFYLESSGVSRSELSGFHDLDISKDFYLANKISARDYDPYWKVYFPRGLS